MGLRIGSPTLLTGHNDAGKTAVLDAIRFLLNDYQLSAQDPTFDSADSYDQTAARPRMPEVCVEGTFTLSEDEAAALDQATPLILRRTSPVPGSAIYQVSTSIPDDERLQGLSSLNVSELKTRVADLGLNPTATNKPELLEALQMAARASPSKLGWAQANPATVAALPAVLRFNPSGMSDAEDAIKTALQTAFKVHEKSENFVGTTGQLRDFLEAKVIEDAADLRQHIKDHVDELGDVTIVPSVSFTTSLKNTQVSVTNSKGEPINLGEAGAGKARRVSLVVWEYNTGLLDGSGDVVILYDEPDTHLDYTHQRNFMRLIRRQADMPNVRMAIATHSMNLIDGVDIADVVLLKHDVGLRTTHHRLTDESEVGQHLGAIAASLGLRNTVLLHERLFVGVEGATETAAFPVLFRLSTGRQLEACGIAMWSCDNNEGALKFAAYLKQHERDVVFIVDQDSKKNSKHLFNTKKLEGYGLTEAGNAIYLGHPNELEDLFGDDLWVRVANLRWRRTDGLEWAASDITALRSGKFSTSLLDLMKISSETGPQNKQEVMTTLALELTSATEVPVSLSAAFEMLITLAAL
jgi:putative ATP-dependent endonuclease of OLD family